MSDAIPGLLGRRAFDSVQVERGERPFRTKHKPASVASTTTTRLSPGQP
jgi:hypothetical protein